MSDEKAFVVRAREQLDAGVEAQSPALQGRLRAARREALSRVAQRAPRRHWLPALAASVFVVVATTAIWLETAREAPFPGEAMLQSVSVADQQLLGEGDDIEFYQDLEFYYWLEQEQYHAG